MTRGVVILITAVVLSHYWSMVLGGFSVQIRSTQPTGGRLAYSRISPLVLVKYDKQHLPLTFTLIGLGLYSAFYTLALNLKAVILTARPDLYKEWVSPETVNWRRWLAVIGVAAVTLSYAFNLANGWYPFHLALLLPIVLNGIQIYLLLFKHSPYYLSL